MSFSNKTKKNSIYILILFVATGTLALTLGRSETAQETREPASNETPVVATTEVKTPQETESKAVSEKVEKAQAITAVEIPTQTKSSKADLVTTPSTMEIPAAIAALSNEKRGLNIILGFGMNNFQYNQDLSDVASRYKGFSPNFNLGVSMQLFEATQIEAAYKSTNLYFDNSTVSQQRTQQIWQSMGVQAMTRVGQGDLKFIYGFELEQLPLPLFELATNKPILRTIQMVNATVGANATTSLNEWTRMIVSARLKYPVSSGVQSQATTFKLTPQVLGDVTLGIEKKILDRAWLGLHAEHQYHSIKFEYVDAVVPANGSQTINATGLKLNLTLEF